MSDDLEQRIALLETTVEAINRHMNTLDEHERRLAALEGTAEPASAADAADATPFEGHVEGNDVTYESTAPDDATPDTPLNL